MLRKQLGELGGTTPSPNAETLEIYKAYLTDLGRIGDRQQALRTFYVALIAALVGAAALAGGDKAVFAGAAKVPVGLIVCGACAGACWMWYKQMAIFAVLYEAKFKTLAWMEGSFEAKPFTRESSLLIKRAHSSEVDQMISLVVGITFAALLLIGAALAIFVPEKAAIAAQHG